MHFIVNRFLKKWLLCGNSKWKKNEQVARATVQSDNKTSTESLKVKPPSSPEFHDFLHGLHYQLLKAKTGNHYESTRERQLIGKQPWEVVSKIIQEELMTCCRKLQIGMPITSHCHIKVILFSPGRESGSTKYWEFSSKIICLQL